MSARVHDPRLRAGVVVGLVFVLGMVVGVAVDRTFSSRAAEAAVPSVTVGDMAQALRLDPVESTRVGAVLDSLRPEIARAAALGPDSLQAVTRRARERIADALPPGRRRQFQQWLDSRHARMMEMMRRMGPEMMGPGMMGPGGAGRGMMRPGMMGPGMMAPDSPGPAATGSGRGPGMMGPGGR